MLRFDDESPTSFRPGKSPPSPASADATTTATSGALRVSVASQPTILLLRPRRRTCSNFANTAPLFLLFILYC